MAVFEGALMRLFLEGRGSERQQKMKRQKIEKCRLIKMIELWPEKLTCAHTAVEQDISEINYHVEIVIEMILE